VHEEMDFSSNLDWPMEVESTKHRVVGSCTAGGIGCSVEFQIPPPYIVTQEFVVDAIWVSYENKETWLEVGLSYGWGVDVNKKTFYAACKDLHNGLEYRQLAIGGYSDQLIGQRVLLYLSQHEGIIVLGISINGHFFGKKLRQDLYPHFVSPYDYVDVGLESNDAANRISETFFFQPTLENVPK